MAKLPFTVKTLDLVPEAHRDAYIPSGDGFKLDIDGPDPEELRGNLTRANREAADRRKALESWEKLGKTPEEIAELVAAQKTKEEKDAEAKGEWERLKTQLNESHANALKEKDGEVGKYKTSFERYLVESQATAAIAQLKGVPELLMPHISSRTRVEEKDGNFTTVVVGDDGKVRYDDKGNPLTISGLVAEMKASPVYGRAFEGENQGGAGARSNAGGNTQTFTTKRSSMTPVEKAAFIAENGSDAYLKLPA